MNTVDVLLTGRLLPGSDANRAAAALAQMTGLPQDKALALLTGGKPKLAKRDLAPEDAQVFVDRFAELGIETSLRPGAKPAAAPQPQPQAASGPPPAPEAPAGPETESAADDAAMSVAAEQATEAAEAAPPGEAAAEREEEVNPYAPPKADLTRRPKKPAEHGRWSDAPADAPAMRGFEWFREAWALFRARPKIWIAPLTVVGLLHFIVLLLPKGGGSVALSLILPVLAGGVAMTAHRLAEAEAEGDPEAATVDFAPRAVRALINMSLCCVLYQTLASLLLAGLFIGLGSGGALLALLLLVPLLAPLYPVNMFGPSLITLGGLGAIAAIRTSLRGGLRNWQPLLLNALAMVIVAMLGLALAVLVTGQAGSGIAGAAAVSLLCTAVFAPLWAFFALTSYFAAREVFYEEDH